MSDFLLEVRSEEIPARMQAGARASLEKLFREQMDAAGVTLDELTVYSTPRRLALIARGLPDATQPVTEEVKGPKVGAPPQALEGFLRKTGLSEDQLVERSGVLFAVTEKPGRTTAEVLAEAIPAICRAFPWPKSMRWGAPSLSTESLRWVRPLSGIVAILGEDLVDCEVGGVRSGYATLGHRFHHPGPITIGGAGDYVDKLRACHVLVDHAERESMVREMSRAAAVNAGLTLVEDDGLVIENAGLTEWPVPLLGRFDPEYLEVPPEVIQLTARTNQKYFICRDAAGQLANAFVCTANIEASDGGAAIVAGNRKVLAARLSDARFFWQQDRKTALAHHAERLARISFHENLGSLKQKVDRVAELARSIVEQSTFPVPETFLQDRALHLKRAAFAQLAVDTAHIAKADLVTEMVGEFPELQATIGSYYAAAEGMDKSVCEAIADQYKPSNQNDDVPSSPLTVAIAIADKLDTLAAFFEIDQKPTGSKDPFALRRAALGIISLITRNQIRISLLELIFYHLPRVRECVRNPADAVRVHRLGFKTQWPKTALELLDFVADRLKVQQREAGVRHDLIDAVFAVGEDDLVRLLARVHALQAFIGTEDGTNLLAGYKRAANILKKEDWQGVEGEISRTGEEDPLSNVDDPDLAPVIAAKMAERHVENARSHTPEPAEQALIDALDDAEPRAAAAVAVEDFAGAMAALASLRAPIDAFFDGVTVNDADPAKRIARLALLDRFRAAVHNVADFSRIEG
ncbi:MAG: glycine--tRNA ligase subunit beta [Pseudomonadota bacterium]